MRFSINSRSYSLEDARTVPGYARRFTYGWRPVEMHNLQDITRVLTSKVWSPIIFSGDHRKIDFFVRSSLLVLDFDTPEYPMTQCLREWCDTMHIIGTTRSHQREKNGVTCDRYRLIVPFDGEITDGRTFTYNYKRMIDRYDADPSAKDLARLFFPCQEIVDVVTEGEKQPILTAPPEVYRPPMPKGGIPLRAVDAFRRIIPKGERNATFYGASKDLYRAGISAEDILIAICASPTYKGTITPAEVRELEATVRSASKSVESELGK